MKIICVGRNYAEHAKELKNEIPTESVLFMKPASSICSGKEWFLPRFSSDIHYEVELVFRIGENINSKINQSVFNGIALGIDFTARDIQTKLKQKGLPWEKAKAFRHSALLSPFLPLDNFPDLKNISFCLEKNGKLVQQGHSKNMLFSPTDLIQEILPYFSLEKDDLIFTGTPAGVGRVEKDDFFVGKLEEETLLSFKIL